MGDYKDITDCIYNDLMSRLEDEGYEDISLNSNINNEIVDLIDPRHENSEAFEELVSEAINIIKEHQ